MSVFGASPDLDRCASKERYLAEKLAELSGVTTGGVASLAHLAQLQVRRYSKRSVVLGSFERADRIGRHDTVMLAANVSTLIFPFCTQRTCAAMCLTLQFIIGIAHAHRIPDVVLG